MIGMRRRGYSVNMLNMNLEGYSIKTTNQAS